MSTNVEVSLRASSLLVRLDGENPVDVIVTYLVGVVIDGQAGTIGGPAKHRLPFDPREDAELAELMRQLADLVTVRLNEQAGLVPFVAPGEAAADKEEL